eukprot:TRINITY_DN18074_c0_g2_i2.p1 TRINITY_DN18074_c0_g2~~TRINITY_DN18074_c0_g2_i2.p1  ORF type:complete len:978 (-),score=164.34 TRINITY_DN18074_c0_g2_i2:85-3018(-)
MEDATALTLYATQTSCNSILTEQRSEIYRVFLICVTYGCALATLVTVPYFWCGFDVRPPLFDDEDIASRDLDAGDLEDLKKEKTKFDAAKSTGRPKDQQRAVAEALTDHTPKMKEAHEHLRLTSSTDEDGDFRGFWDTRLYEMSEIGGSSVELYFRLLVAMGFCFTYMSIVTSPLAMFSWNGNFLPDAGSAFAKTTVGNLGWIAGAGVPQEQRLIIIGCQGIDIKEMTAIFGKLDIVALVIYLLTIFYFRWVMVPRAMSENNDEVQTVGDFSVQIDHLPNIIPDQGNYAMWLTKHLEERLEAVREADSAGGCCKRRRDLSALPVPKVKELTLVRDYGKRLGSIKERARLLQAKEVAQFKNATKKVARIAKKLDKIKEYLQESLQPEAELPVLRAYAILSTLYDVGSLLTAYRFSHFALFRRFQSFDFRFKETSIRVQKAPEPSTIICENQDVPLWERYVRRGIVFLLWIVAVLLSGLLIMLVNYGASTQTEGAASQSLDSATCDGGVFPDTTYKCSYQNASLWTKAYARNLTGDALDCFCVTTGYSKVFQDEELFNPVDGVCKTWLQNTGTSVFVGVVASMAVVTLNYVFRAAFIAFSEFERPLSVSALEVSKMRKVFVSQFVSTGIIVVLINYHSEIKLPPFGYGDYADFERGWYTVVGGAIVTNMLLNTFTPSAASIGIVLYKRLKRWMLKNRVKTQDELLELFTNPPFDISSRYAAVLASVLVTLLFSSGLPILNNFGAVFCFVSFWTDKWVLLRGSRKPPIYDSTLAREAFRILLIAVPLHAGMGIGMLGHLCTFPSDPIGGSLGKISATAASAASGSSGQDVAGNDLWARATRDSTWILFVALLISILILVLMVLFGILGATFGEAWKVVVAVLCKGKSAKIVPASTTKVIDDGVVLVSADGICWDDVSDRLSMVCPPISYRVEANMEFAPLVKYLRLDPHALTPRGEKAVEIGTTPKTSEDTPASTVDPGI